jgi:hypothetical protein
MGGPSVGHSQIRIQIAYVKGLGVRFRIAAKEVKGMGVHTPAERSSPANTPTESWARAAPVTCRRR